jgi:hypothetical protein
MKAPLIVANPGRGLSARCVAFCVVAVLAAAALSCSDSPETGKQYVLVVQFDPAVVAPGTKLTVTVLGSMCFPQ